MIPSKRFREEEEDDIQIRVAAGEPLGAESHVLRTFSSCARALPADATEWDVKGLLFDGQPFSHETVSCWLRCAQRLVEGSAGPGEQDIHHLSTVTGLTQVLAFADAVGTRSSLLKTLCSQVPQLKFVVQLPEQVLELPVAGYEYSFVSSHPSGKKLWQRSLQREVVIGQSLVSDKQCHDVQQQVANQLSLLLQVAHVMAMQPLIDILHSFVLQNVQSGTQNMRLRLLSGVVDLVFTDAVLQAARASGSSSSTLSKEAYVSGVLSCSLTPGATGHISLLRPLPGTLTFKAYADVLMFNAELLRDFAGVCSGSTVKVELDLFRGEEVRLQLPVGSTIVRLPAQLLLGHSFSTPAALDEFLKASPQ